VRLHKPRVSPRRGAVTTIASARALPAVLIAALPVMWAALTAAARHPSQPPVATARKARPAISTSNPDGRLIKPRRSAPILPAGSGTVPLAGSITRRRRLSITLLRPSITPRPAAAAVTATAVAAACRMAPAAVAATPVAAAVTAAAEGNSSIQQSAGGPGRCRPAFLFLSRGTEADCTNGSYSCLFVFIRG